jgi:hypothetical protein
MRRSYIGYGPHRIFLLFVCSCSTSRSHSLAGDLSWQDISILAARPSVPEEQACWLAPHQHKQSLVKSGDREGDGDEHHRAIPQCYCRPPWLARHSEDVVDD